MLNTPYSERFLAACQLVEDALASLAGDESHYRLVNFALAKIKQDFFDHKIIPGLLAPAMVYRAITGRLDDKLTALAAAHLVYYACLDLMDDIEDHELDRPVWQELGYELAINTGNSLLFLALLLLERLAKVGVNPKTLLRIKHLFIHTGWQLSIGQHRDLYSRHQEPLSPACVLETIALKTGSSVQLYFASAAELAAATPELVAQLAHLGRLLGVLLQIQGDYLDIWQAADSSDLRNRYQTLPLVICRARLSPEDVVNFDVARSQAPHDPAARDILRYLMRKSGCIDDLNRYLEDYRTQILKQSRQIRIRYGCAMDEIEALVARFKPLGEEGVGG